jgi:hypothetical protein
VAREQRIEQLVETNSSAAPVPLPGQRTIMFSALLFNPGNGKKAKNSISAYSRLAVGKELITGLF